MRSHDRIGNEGHDLRNAGRNFCSKSAKTGMRTAKPKVERYPHNACEGLIVQTGCGVAVTGETEIFLAR